MMAGDICALTRSSLRRGISEPPVPMETPMKSVNTICMSVLLLGAAAIAAPAMAADASADNSASVSDQASSNQQAADNSSASSSQQATDESSNSSQQAMNNTSSSSNNSQVGTQTAMNSTGDAAEFSSIADKGKKYSRKTRARDSRAEHKITQELNRQARAAAAPNQQTASAQ